VRRLELAAGLRGEAFDPYSLVSDVRGPGARIYVRGPDNDGLLAAWRASFSGRFMREPIGFCACDRGIAGRGRDHASACSSFRPVDRHPNFPAERMPVTERLLMMRAAVAAMRSRAMADAPFDGRSMRLVP